MIIGIHRDFGKQKDELVVLQASREANSERPTQFSNQVDDLECLLGEHSDALTEDVSVIASNRPSVPEIVGPVALIAVCDDRAGAKRLQAGR